MEVEEVQGGGGGGWRRCRVEVEEVQGGGGGGWSSERFHVLDIINQFPAAGSGRDRPGLQASPPRVKPAGLICVSDVCAEQSKQAQTFIHTVC